MGVAIAGPITDRFGRRGGMVGLVSVRTVFLQANKSPAVPGVLDHYHRWLWAPRHSHMQLADKITGAVVVTVAKNQHYLLGGRFVLGFGVSITTTAAPAYVVELSPPQWRGRLTGL